jgi:multiple sugar transport system ATP-binding protein
MADVVLDEVYKIYDNGFEAVSGLSLAVADGEFLVLVGPSGCGKSTALRMVAGLEDITKGELRIGGHRMNEVPSRDRDIAMVFQSYALYPHMTVRDNISFGLRLRRMAKEEIAKRVHKSSTTLGLTELLERKPGMLSGGQRQRVAMGRAIVRDPQVFLMDEPLSNLDAKLRVQMRSDIQALQQELGVTTIYVTHDQVEAMTMGDRVAVMRKGVLLQVDAPQRLYDDPDNLFVAGFIGSPPMNLVQGEIADGDGGSLVVRLGEQSLVIDDALVAQRPAVRSYVGRSVAVGIRSEDLTQPGHHRDDAPPDRRLHSTALLTEALGSEIVVHFEVPAPPVETDDTRELRADAGAGDAIGALEIQGTKFVASFSPRSTVRPGDAIEVAVDTSRLYLFDLETGAAIRS